MAVVLGLLALTSVCWPASRATTRLERALASADDHGVAGDAVATGDSAQAWVRGRVWPGLPRSRGLRILLGCGAVVGLSQVWPMPVALVVVVAAVTVGRALNRGRRNRAVVAQEQAALEALGIVVAELRAGRAPEDALDTAGRHCRHPDVDALLSWLSRSMRLGGRVTQTVDANEATWRGRLIAGVRLSHQTGCALADVIAAVESDLAALARRRAELRATAAGHRATVALLAGLPILGLVMGSGIGAEPLRILTTTPIGHILLLSGIALDLLGLAWSRRLADRALSEG